MISAMHTPRITAIFRHQDILEKSCRGCVVQIDGKSPLFVTIDKRFVYLLSALVLPLNTQKQEQEQCSK
jgi:hypothetical protein